MDSDNDSYHSENEFCYPDEISYFLNVKRTRTPCLKMAAVKIQHKSHSFNFNMNLPGRNLQQTLWRLGWTEVIFSPSFSDPSSPTLRAVLRLYFASIFYPWQVPFRVVRCLRTLSFCLALTRTTSRNFTILCTVSPPFTIFMATSLSVIRGSLPFSFTFCFSKM